MLLNQPTSSKSDVDVMVYIHTSRLHFITLWALAMTVFSKGIVRSCFSDFAHLFHALCDDGGHRAEEGQGLEDGKMAGVRGEVGGESTDLFKAGSRLE